MKFETVEYSEKLNGFCIFVYGQALLEIWNVKIY